MINNVEYVRKEDINHKMAVNTDGLEYVIIRTYSAGVHVGYLKKKDVKEVILIDARRIWYWDGAASLSQMAVDGVSKPSNCKFSVPVLKIELSAIEIIYCTDEAEKNIAGVPLWKK